MAHHVVVLPHQLGPAVTGDPAEVVIGVGDHAPQIRGGHQLFISCEIHFLINKMAILFAHVAPTFTLLLSRVLGSNQHL